MRKKPNALMVYIYSKGYPISEIERKSGVSRYTIMKIGTAKIRPETIDCIASVMKVPYEEVLDVIVDKNMTRLRYELLKRKWSFSSLAAKSGIDKSTISKISLYGHASDLTVEILSQTIGVSEREFRSWIEQ